MFIYGLGSCEPKEEIVTTDSKAQLEFSTDSLKFNTVFVNTASASRAVWVYNRRSNAIKITEIKLEQANPAYQLIVDGQETTQANNVLLRGKDSLLVIVKVTIPATQDTAAFIQTDALSFLVNSNQQRVVLVSYGQNAYFHSKTEITTNTTWKADKPHVVYGSVSVAAGGKLIIEPGSKIYFHKDAALIVKGSLEVKGTVNKRVLFTGDRRERLYAAVPGQWLGIKFEATSTYNYIQFADIKNATFGLWAANPDQDETDYDLKIEQSIIQNMFETGILSHGADVQVTNTLITNCGQSAVLGLGGGNYNFTYCTLANYTVGFRPGSVTLLLTDQLKVADRPNQEYRVQLLMQNSIVWAGKHNSLIAQDQIQLKNEAGTTPQLQINHSVVQTKSYQDHPAFACCDNLLNVDPLFKAPIESAESNLLDFRLDSLSPVSNTAVATPAILKDLVDKNRHLTTPDPGAYERLNP
ncbi:hypothetical protein [Adhaeribacter radiodurans]|uniref:Right-handed parallel beta-helix repeat-containing protein n=1 Tax=Adhaeribacter radiodurans TaxID=2745197 RepID=A0A7L7LDP2_9BACT|nr:hypothetical protein [Adhaeribacter radiodurans]QMU30966.1 hypothetical protein HUW48_24375 [Adhaeribacter radiodurans]